MGKWLLAVLERVAAILTLPGALLAQAGPPSGVEIVDAVSRTVGLVVGVLVVAILLPVAFIVYRKVFSSFDGGAPPPKDPVKEIARFERKGDFLQAASLCEKEGDHVRAAVLFEKGKDFSRAAEMYEISGDLKKAVEFHLRSGGSLRAAGLYVKLGEYVEAAKIFKLKGDHLRAAKAFELFGSKPAAAREYGLAGQFEKAARLLKEEEMYAEAAEAYFPLLGEDGLNEENVDRYYTYAAYLALAGRREDAVAVYRDIQSLKGDYRKVRGNLRALGSGDGPSGSAVKPGLSSPAAPEGHPPDAAGAVGASLREEIDSGAAAEKGGEEGLHKVTTLRMMIAYGRLEPRYSMRLWTQVIKVLATRHGENTFFGSLSPEDIAIDMQNNVTISMPREGAPVYTAPEVLAGQAPGPHSDVFSMGVILFEMVTGSLEGLGEKRPSELKEDIPPWLDDLIIKCTKKDRRDRCMNTEEIFTSLVKLKKAQQDR